MCASCSIVCASRCSVRVACWPEPTRTSKIAGSATPIPVLKKSAAAKPGVDLHRRSQLSPRFYPARHLEPDRLSSGSSRDRTAQEREDFWAIELKKTRFHYRQDTVFNASTYFAFLQQLARSYRRQGAVLIQDNATYHKDGDVWAWFDANRHWLEVHQLPPYSPELNPTERLWRYTRQTGTHN